MQLIQQARLFFQQGNSDKVYEVDLCEVGPGEYVVNFRYGRRGANLKAGTKTVFPVSLDKAQKEFDKLVKGKTRKGYAELPESKGLPADSAAVEQGEDARIAKVLAYLEAAAEGKYDEKRWKLSRLIWKAGELRLKAAGPFLAAIAPRKDAMFNYALAWALARCAAPQEALPMLRDLSLEKDVRVARIAGEALALLGKDSDRQKLADLALPKMPGSIASAIRNQDATALAAAIKELIFDLKADHNNFLYLIYRSAPAYPFVLPVLLHALQSVPFKPPFFRAIRYILKVAEMRTDLAVEGLLMARLEREKPHFRMPEWGSMWAGGQWIKPKKELAKPDSKLAYSDRTRKYLRARTMRNLDLLATHGQAYTQVARHILLQYTDADNRGDQSETVWSYDYSARRYNTYTKYFPGMGEFLLLFNIIYGNSTRYMPGPKGRRWKCRPPYKPGEPVPTAREESHPKLWDEAPADLVALLAESECLLVHEFAAKAFQANPRRAEFVDVPFLKKLLNQPYSVTNSLALVLAEELYDPANPNLELILALLECQLPAARMRGLEWAETTKKQLLGSANWLARLLLSPFTEVRTWISRMLKSTQVDAKIGEAVLQDSLLRLLAVPTEDAAEETQEWFGQVVDQLQLHFAKHLSRVSASQLEEMASHPWEAMQLLAGQVLLRHLEPNAAVPEAALQALINSEWSAVRGLGVEIFGQLPPAILRERKDIVAGFCISQHAEIRTQSRPIIAKIIADDPEFAAGLMALFLPALWRKEAHPGVHADIMLLLRDTLKDHLSRIPEASIWRLIDSDFRPAHELGDALLRTQVDTEKISFARIVELGSHELLNLRKFVWDYFTNNVPLIKYKAAAALKLMDAKWEDTRTFAIEYFREQFSDEDWTPKLLVGICDSVRVELQAFGQEMITRFFQEEDGEQYLLQLSQHPKTELQLFVTNYLERFASGNSERIIGLSFYFTAVLSKVNKGRVAKERVFTFLHKEAKANEKTAAFVIPLLSRISLTIAIRDKAHCIRILTDLCYQYPHLDSSLTLHTFPTL